jgi:hypothetical protein
MVIFGAVSLLGGIVGVYIKSSIALAKIQIELVQMKKDLMAKEIAICLLEKNYREDAKENRDDHKYIIGKIDKLVETLIGK